MRTLLKQQPRNDLQAVACKLYPEIARYIAVLSQFGNALMTGSGACVFAEFASREQAEAVIQQLPTEMRSVLAQGLSKHPLQDWMYQ